MAPGKYSCRSSTCNIWYDLPAYACGFVCVVVILYCICIRKNASTCTWMHEGGNNMNATTSEATRCSVTSVSASGKAAASQLPAGTVQETRLECGRPGDDR